MARPIRKYIMIPEYRPLFAMQECFGPQHGPLKEPCPTPIPVIGKLLRQDGENKLTIYEVLRNADRTFTAPVLLTLDNYTLPYEEILGGKKADPGPALEPAKVEANAIAPVIGNFNPSAPAPEPELPKEPEPEEPIPEDAPVAANEPATEEDTAMDDQSLESADNDSSDEADHETPEEGSDEPTESADVPQDEAAEDSAVSATVETETPELPPEPEVTVTAQSGVEVEAITPKVKPYDQMSKKERKEARRKAAEAAGKPGIDTREG